MNIDRPILALLML